MRKLMVSLGALAFLSSVSAQNVGIGTSVPNPSAKLDVTSTNSGLLVPRVALTMTTAAAPVTAPATSLLVYNTATVADVTPGYYYWTGSAWARFITGTSADWSLTGNSGTNPATNFIGTTNGVDFVTRTNNVERVRITSVGWVGMGTATPNAPLNVIGGSNDANNGSFIIGNTASTNLRMGYVAGSRSWIQSHGGLPLYINELGNNVIINSGAGNVGVGSTAPDAKMSIQQGATPHGAYDDGKTLYVTGNFNAGTNFDGGIEFRHDNQSQGIGFGYQSIYATGYNATQQLNIYSKGAAPLVLNAYGGAGNVGVGTTTPTSKLDVAGKTETDQLQVGTAGGAGTTFNKMQSGTGTLGGSGGGVLVVTITFPTPFTSVPRVICTPRTQTGQSYTDTFSVTTKNITTNSFQVNIHREDCDGCGWGQGLLLDWFATN